MSTVVCYAEVLATRRISPSMVRVVFGGPELTRITSGGFDQRVKLFFPAPGQAVARLPVGDDWFAAYRAMPEELRAVLRTYTVRAHRPAVAELDIDFALHASGVASDWARSAKPGDMLGIAAPAVGNLAPGGVDYRPGDAEWQLLVGDETALPAIGAIVEELPPQAKAFVLLDVAAALEIQEFTTDADVQVTWLPRSAGRTPLEALRDMELPPGKPYAWIAGEASRSRAINRHLVEDRGWDRASIHCAGYWRGEPAVALVSGEAELREVVRPPVPAIADKGIDRIDPASARFLAESTLFLLATQGPDGTLDLSPRGDPPGSVLVLDGGRRLAIADRRGNRRLDSMRNILHGPQVALLFLVPGAEHALRVNGKASVVSSAPWLSQLADGDRVPDLALLVEVEELFVHCGQALRRSGVWDHRAPGEPVPSASELFQSQTAAKQH